MGIDIRICMWLSPTYVGYTQVDKDNRFAKIGSGKEVSMDKTTLTPDQWLEWFQGQDKDKQFVILMALMEGAKAGYDLPEICHLVYWARSGQLFGTTNRQVH
jgi:hypothetical protein